MSFQAFDETIGIGAFVPTIPYTARVLLYLAASILASVIGTTLYFNRKHKNSIPGPKFVMPLVGGLIDMIRNPYAFWEQQRLYNPNGLSWNSIIGMFMLFSTRAETSQKIFAMNGPDTLTLALHPNAKTILGDDNIAFMTGPEHKALRTSFLHLFSSKALGIYLTIQERTMNKHIAEWLENHPVGGKPTEMREKCRALSAETSQSVFLGPYLRNPVSFSADYHTITVGFLSAPIYLPGTGLWKAVRARERVMVELLWAVSEAKKYIIAGGEPRCLLDFWTQEVLRSVAEAEASQQPPPKHAVDHKMATTVMDFLFASQDATTAATTWIVANMADNPEMLQKVRDEQKKVRPCNEPMTFDLLQEMKYARQVVLESLRFRPVAPMMPMEVHKDMEFEGKTVPKGSLLIASIWGACMEGFPNPHTFDPDRMGDERQEDRKYQKQYIPFGVGPHRCVGYNYAINQLTLFLVTIASKTQWVRERKEDSNNVVYLPTLYPKDLLCTWAPNVGGVA
eukprot:PhM_4_TR9144/c0_g1_i1/m.90240/K09832/CYP710A; sterol 22-desaturase